MRAAPIQSSCTMHPEPPRAVGSLDLEPVAEFHVSALGWSRCDDDAVCANKPTNLGPQGGGTPGAAHHGNIEALKKLGPSLFKSPVHEMTVREGKLPDHGGQKRSSLLPCLQQGDIDIRHDSRKWYPGNSGAGAYVAERPAFQWNHPREQEAIDDYVIHDPGRCGRSDEALGFLPFYQ